MTFRTTTVTGTLLGVGGAPVVGATVTAQLLGAEDVIFTSDGTLVTTTSVYDTTNGSGNWSLAVVAPQDLTPSGLQYSFTAPSFLLYTTSFAYSGTPVTLTSISSSGATPSSTTATIYEYLVDPEGNPITGATVTCKVAQNCINSTNNISILTTQTLTTTTDNNGYYSFNVVPSTSLLPSGTYYQIYENKSTQAKTVNVPSGGGAVNTLLVTPAVTTQVTISPYSIQADLTEASTFDTLGSSSTLINNLNRIRWVLSQYSGGNWYAVGEFVTLSPPTPQTGNINITGTLTATESITSGSLIVNSGATMNGTLTVTGSIAGSAIPNVGTVPTGSYAVYTTPHGRQTLGLYTIFL